MQYGDCRCRGCGRVFSVSLGLFDPKEVKVARCRVCPVNDIYAVCSRCADPEKVTKGACPSCGAGGQWEIKGMIAGS